MKVKSKESWFKKLLQSLDTISSSSSQPPPSSTESGPLLRSDIKSKSYTGEKGSVLSHDTKIADDENK
ncbi:hypothetical protein Glove_51g51 [Diversispora epigaea]|uniref:Uncharacterized protein n=1 Tax=Diversispora epigaea TaxID=1348612 RepID=A0A397JDL4_9GLOM|nr:hypothetical protein Glove_51g51 [Diversispora epigaea]